MLHLYLFTLDASTVTVSRFADVSDSGDIQFGLEALTLDYSGKPRSTLNTVATAQLRGIIILLDLTWKVPKTQSVITTRSLKSQY